MLRFIITLRDEAISDISELGRDRLENFISTSENYTSLKDAFDGFLHLPAADHVLDKS